MTVNLARHIAPTAVALAMLIAALVAWRNWSPPAPAEPLTLAVAASALGAPLLVADRQGFLAAEGVQSNLLHYPTGKSALDAMLNGEAEVATVAETPIMFAGLAGKPLRVIANISSSTEHAVVARADRGIRERSDLRGRRIGVALGTTAHYFIHALLTDQGLDESAVELVDLPVREQAEALAAGRVDAVATFPPYSTECRRALGERARIFPAGIRYAGYGSLVVAPDLVERRPEVLARLLRAVDHAIGWMRANPEEARAIAAEAIGIDSTVLEETWDSSRLGLELGQGFLVLLNAEARWAIAAGLVPGAAVPNYLDLIDTSALARLRPDVVTLIQLR
ncbi:ABC transporter substrate-binding protein [Thiocapsa marina]|uniref:ABC-type transporter, periplasmic subunit family 3 n=1 Tax=Thiocapsa marina 5811 TaxID=768671 RepID=F9UBZ5_9GAMM|nr:NrtA/SsuA/CpmA family ABC transporter substrate-binding protein [Thiocapsa marina]EGV18463.1 ABC-type transporter, periplasmic subunit family 3 [Thiocapsa marina 5811]